jgi:hypothetical protein
MAKDMFNKDWKDQLDNLINIKHVTRRCIGLKSSAGSQSPVLNGEEEFEVLKHVVNNEPLSMHFTEILKSALHKHEMRETKRQEIQNHHDAFKQEVFFVCGFVNQPAIIGRAKYDPNLVEDTYVVTDLRPYATIEDLPKEYEQLVLTYKMWRVNMESKYGTFFDEAQKLAYDSSKLFPAVDTYSSDFDVCTYTSNCYGLGLFGKINAFVTPVVEIPNAN